MNKDKTKMFLLVLNPFVTIYLKKKIMYFYSKLLHKQGQTVHMLQFFGIYIPLARLYIYVYIFNYIYTHIQIYIHIYLHVLLLNFMTTFSLRMLCLKKPYNMDFSLKKLRPESSFFNLIQKFL